MQTETMVKNNLELLSTKNTNTGSYIFFKSNFIITEVEAVVAVFFCGLTIKRETLFTFMALYLHNSNNSSLYKTSAEKRWNAFLKLHENNWKKVTLNKKENWQNLKQRKLKQERNSAAVLHERNDTEYNKENLRRHWHFRQRSCGPDSLWMLIIKPLWTDQRGSSMISQWAWKSASYIPVWF